MATRDAPARTVKTSETVFGIVEALHHLEGGSVTEIANHLGLAKSTVSDHLATLDQKEYIVHDDGTYRLGLKFLYHGKKARDHLPVTSAAVSPLADLAEATGECAWLVVEEHGKGVFVDKALGDNAVQTMGSPGRCAYLHTTAPGKAILARLPEERVDSIVEMHGLPRVTKNTITEREVLEEQFAEIRETKLAYNDEEATRGVKSVASPILANGSVRGALSVAGPKSRLTDERLAVIEKELLNAVNVTELEIEYNFK